MGCCSVYLGKATTTTRPFKKKKISLFLFCGHSTQEPASSRVTVLFCGPTHEPVLATANAGKIGRGFGKNAGEWTGRVEITKEEIPGSKHRMFGYILTYSRF